MGILEKRTPDAKVRYFSSPDEIERHILEENPTNAPSLTVAVGDIVPSPLGNGYHKMAIAIYKEPGPGGRTGFLALDSTRFGKSKINAIDNVGDGAAAKLAGIVAKSKHVSGVLKTLDTQYSPEGCGIFSAVMVEAMCARKQSVIDICKNATPQARATSTAIPGTLHGSARCVISGQNHVGGNFGIQPIDQSF